MGEDLDLKLVQDIKRGNISAFEISFKKYYSPLCLLAVKYLNDLDSSREVVQSLFVHIWEHREKINIRHTVKTYLITAVRFNCQRYRKRRTITLPVEQISDPADKIYDSLELDELYRQLISAIEELPEQCRKIFKMSRFEDMKYAEIAQRLNLSVKTVEAQMGKALKTLRKKFGAEY